MLSQQLRIRDGLFLGFGMFRASQQENTLTAGTHMISTFRPLTDTFVTSNLGTNLILKACGFVEAHHARITAVSDGHLKLQIGHGFWERCLLGRTRMPISVEIRFEDMQATDGDKLDAPHVNCSRVSVKIRPKSWGWSKSQFQDASRKLLWQLRSHFMAYSCD